MAESPALKAVENFQRGMAESPALKAVENFQRGMAESPALKAIENFQRGMAESPALKAIENFQRGMAESPALKAVENFQRGMAESPALKAVENFQRGMAESPALKAVENFQRGMAESPALKAIENFQRGMAESPALKAVENFQRGMAESPALKAIENFQRGVLLPSQADFRKWYRRAYESALRELDERWADIHTENPDHPQPVLFVVASFGMAVGLPYYEAAKLRSDDGELLVVLEQIATERGFVERLQDAVRAAPLLNEIQKRHLVTALSWMTQQQYVDAYPPFYNGLEACFFSVARASGVIDEQNRFMRKKGKASKVDDLFDDLISDPRFKRFLRAWIFGDRGNPFRHGDVSDIAECRRQSLRLMVALIGWLETFADWDSSTFRVRLEASAAARLAIGA